MGYKLGYGMGGTIGYIIQLSDSAFIPLCEDNTDYQTFLEWNKIQESPLDLNSTIAPSVNYENEIKTQAEMQRILREQAVTNLKAQKVIQ